MFSNSNKSVSFEFCTQRILKKHEYNSPCQVPGIQPKTPCHREQTMSFNPRRISSHTFPSGLLFSTQISSVEGREGGAGAGGEAVGGIPGGKIMPGGGGMDPPGGGINGGLLK